MPSRSARFRSREARVPRRLQAPKAPDLDTRAAAPARRRGADHAARVLRGGQSADRVQTWAPSRAGRIWSAAVVWAGLADPGETRAELDEVDADNNVLADLLAGWDELANGWAASGCTVARALQALRDDSELHGYPRIADRARTAATPTRPDVSADASRRPPYRPPPRPDRIRRITGGFAFVPNEFLHHGFFASLGHTERSLYFFLVLAGDRNGVSFTPTTGSAPPSSSRWTTISSCATASSTWTSSPSTAHGFSSCRCHGARRPAAAPPRDPGRLRGPRPRDDPAHPPVGLRPAPLTIARSPAIHRIHRPGGTDPDGRVTPAWDPHGS